ncbi:MAG: ATP-binding protein [Betaproteobacteria bacterium]
MKRLQRFVPHTLLARTFVLVSLLIFVSVATWLTLFSLAEHEPHARQLAEMTVSVVNLTNASLIAADPAKRQSLLRDFAESEGVHIYPIEITDDVEELPDNAFFRTMLKTAKPQLRAGTRFAGAVNGQEGIWVSFSIDNAGEDYYWLMLPAEHAESDVPWKWLGWGGASLALALLVAWLMASRISLPLRTMSNAASEVGQGKYPAPISETGATELRQLAKTFNRMSKDLERMEKERAEVLAGISHDLRTPLARLRLESEMSISDDEARAAVVEDIEQMDTIIAQFLDYARGDNGEPFQLSDINELLNQLAVAQERSLPALKISPEILPPTLIQRKALTRAVTNLIENARKYGGNELAIETRVAGNTIVIDALDRGPGIPEAEVERMKRPFTRLENARTNATGTGLGLAIVDRIAVQHGGQLELLPREGGGLIARLRLPIRNPS